MDKIIAIVIILLAMSHNCESSQMRFTNIICNATDPSYFRVDTCTLKAVSRSVQFYRTKFTVLELPLTDLELRFQFMKRLSGWKPFLYDFTVRCNFTRQLNQLQKMVWNMIRNQSNIKCDCPYNQTFELARVENIYINENLKLLPLPTGKYGLFITLKTYNKLRAYLEYHVAIE